jgi:Fe2+ transport system protein FeoA
MRQKPVDKQLLAVMRPGEQGEVISFLHPEYPAMRRLASLGFLPGEKFILERCSPDYLIRYGYTRLAMNRRLAREILVCKMEVFFGYRREVP